MKIAGYTELRRIHDGGQSVVYRAMRKSDGASVVLKLLRGPYPSPVEQARFRAEYELTRRLAGAGVVEVEGWANNDGLPMIVLEDFGAESLERVWEQGAPPLSEALQVATQVAEALQRVHDARVLHLDINPSNVVRSADTGIVKLIDFGMATDLPRQSASLSAEQVMRGTLRFAAPEQTGRLNRSIDYRTDLYSLGATLYWLFAGRPPFESDDPLELVHAHVARRPQPIAGVPGAVSAVVCKLLEKNAQDRYQSISGLLADLDTCRMFAIGADDSEFVPGAHDHPVQFTLPERLYGRESELEELNCAFERAADGGREVVLVKGSAGMGKSSLVAELQRTVVSRHGAYVAGKFDQFKRSVPYAGLSSALRRFVRRVLMQQHGDLEQWRGRWQEAVGPNGRLLTGIVPELELLLGEQPPVPTLPPLESEARLHRTVRRFTRELADEDHPLVLFLDDLQWADLPSLSLLRVLATDPRQTHVLLVGAYRDDEVTAKHPVMAFLHDLTTAGVQVAEVSVAPLQREDVERFVADTVGKGTEESSPLARVVAEKTGSNPFFLHRFLQSLGTVGLVSFDSSSGWTWDLASIAAMDVTDNVVGFLAGQLTSLPEAALRTLEAASIVGNVFGVSKLAAALELAEDDVLVALHEPLVQGLIEEVPHSDELHFRFLHDRIQQAAYEQSTTEVRQSLHRHVGEGLLAETAQPETSELLFEIVDHLNVGDSDEPRLAALNLAAGRRALSGSAFAPALHYLEATRRLLGNDGWSEAPEMMRDVTKRAAHAASLLALYDKMELLLEDAAEHASDPLDVIELHRVKIDALTMQNRTAEAVGVGLEALRLLGIELPSEPREADIVAGLGATTERLEGFDLSALLEMSPPDDRQTVLAMEMLAGVAPPAYFVNQALLPLLGVELVRLTLERGPTSQSAYGFALLGLVLCDVGHIPEGHAFGELAWALTSRFDDKQMRVRAGHVALAFTRHWREPAPDFMPEYGQLCELAVDIGDFEYAAYIGMMHTIFGFHLTDDLEALTRSASLYTSMMREMNQLNGLAVQTMVHQAVINLTASSADSISLHGELFDEPQMLAVFEDLGDVTCLFVFHCLKCVLAALHGEWQRALELADVAKVHIQGAAGTIHKVALEFWEALAALEVAVRSSGSERDRLIERAEGCLALLEVWAEQNPSAYAQRPVLVRAALDRARDEHAAAMAGFERAAKLARANGVPGDEAAALRAAGEMCVELGWATAARGYLIEARYAFERWGAHSVVSELESAHAAVVGNIAASSDRTSVSRSSGTHSLPNLDVMAVVQSSQAIAREIELDQLVRTVVQLSMKASGATRCAVVVPQVDGLHVSAVGVSEPSLTVTLLDESVGQSRDLAHSVVQFVAQTREELLLEDATVAELTANDPYVREHGVRSMLCLPVQQQGRLQAILYLEHRNAPGVFTSERVALMRVLLAQAAISAENAVLVETLEEQVRARTEQLAAASEAKSTFLRSMTHELRTPLNSILGYTQLLLEQQSEGTSVRDALATIERSGRHLLALINDVLDMNKIEAGKLELEPEPVELHGFVEGVVRFFRPEAERRGIALHASTDPALPRWIQADPRRLHQVMLNLLGNAVKFTEQGSVSIEARRVESGLEVVVEDTGTGIPAERLSSIFEPFEQAGASSQRARGTGLGLAIARQIARQMGGDLTVESEVGEGSRFVFSAPLSAADAPDDQPEDDSTPSPVLVPAMTFERPSEETMGELREFAKLGAYSELVDRAEELLRHAPGLRTFVDQLRNLSRDFDDDGVARLLEPEA